MVQNNSSGNLKTEYKFQVSPLRRLLLLHLLFAVAMRTREESKNVYTFNFQHYCDGVYVGRVHKI